MVYIKADLYPMDELRPGVTLMTPGYINPNYIVAHYIMDRYFVHFGVPTYEFLRGTPGISAPNTSNIIMSKLISTNEVDDTLTNEPEITSLDSDPENTDLLNNEGEII